MCYLAGSILDYKNQFLSGNIAEDIALFKEIFNKNDILRVRTVEIGNSGISAAFFYFDGMVNNEILNQSVIRSMVTARVPKGKIPDHIYVSKNILFAGEVSSSHDLSEMLCSMLYGDTVLIIDGSKTALIINTKGWRTRGIDEPADERILQGPREGFDEAAMLNLALIRRKLLTPDLCIEMQRVGRRTGTAVFICYLGSLAQKETVEKLKKQISEIDIDGILDSNYIAEHIRSHKYSLLKTVGTTERPDIVAARLLEGRVAVVVDGTPVVLTLPYLFSENFQSDEDYYQNFTVSAIGRILRYICFFIAVSVPAVFVSLTTFHANLLPTDFVLTVSGLREGVPMSTVAECFMLVLVFEILKETGIRTPQSQGSALSIVGGLVVGQAAVEAKIVSAPTLIAVALSGIAGLMVPRLKGIVVYLKIILLAAGTLFGLYGYVAVGTVFLIRVLNMKSFDTDYTVSLRRATFQSLKDTLFRAPWPKMKLRPSFNKNIKRQR